MCFSVRCYMGFSAKLLMDRVLLLVLMPTLITADAEANVTSSTPLCNCIPSTTNLPCTTSEPKIVMQPPVIGRIKVKWLTEKPCEGHIMFFLNFTKSVMRLCNNQFTDLNDEKLGKELCEERRCGGFFEFKKHKKLGFMIHENLTTTPEYQCTTASLICKENKELVAYKVMTGLLLTLIILVFLCRFAQPAYIAVHKRFSQKQQNRWVGPTQSQSVSYHRGQASHPNNNTTKRQSFPGLERLTVYPSREPSSNRNSDYDSYGI